MNKNGLYAFYGSLRKGMENYHYYKEHLVFIRSQVLQGFKMFSKHEYPYAVKTKNRADTIVVELFKIADPVTEQTIHQMEIDAGYIFDEVEITEQNFGIYLFAKQNAIDKEVRCGDWADYKNDVCF